jgi:hypothetical protein
LGSISLYVLQERKKTHLEDLQQQKCSPIILCLPCFGIGVAGRGFSPLSGKHLPPCAADCKREDRGRHPGGGRQRWHNGPAAAGCLAESILGSSGHSKDGRQSQEAACLPGMSSPRRRGDTLKRAAPLGGSRTRTPDRSVQSELSGSCGGHRWS